MYYNEKPNLRNFSRIARKYFSMDVGPHLVINGWNVDSSKYWPIINDVADVLRGTNHPEKTIKQIRDSDLREGMTRFFWEINTYMTDEFHGASLCPKLELSIDHKDGEEVLIVKRELLTSFNKTENILYELTSADGLTTYLPFAVVAEEINVNRGHYPVDNIIELMTEDAQAQAKLKSLYQCATMLVGGDFYEYLLSLFSPDKAVNVLTVYLVIMYISVYKSASFTFDIRDMKEKW